MNLKNKKFIVVLLIALFIKLFLFIYAEIYAPRAKFQIDSEIYIQTAKNLISHGAFTRQYYDDRKYSPELFRTPGYPLFLGIFNGVLKVPFRGIILIQIFLTILTAFIVFKTTLIIEPRFAYLSALIVLFDPPVTIFSLMLLTETLFLFLMSVFMYFFVKYLKVKKFRYVFISALLIAMAAYIRPVAYFLGVAVGIFMIYFSFRSKAKIIMVHTLVLLFTIYSLIGLWHYRNHKVAGLKTFSTVTDLASFYRRNYRHDDAITKSLPPSLYYLNAASRCFVSLMTLPGTLKNFGSGMLKHIGKIFGYLWVAFWLIGFLVGISKIRKSIYLQFLLYVTLYFICASIGGILFGVSSRQRVPMVPFIAILSAYGWSWIASVLNKRREACIEG